LAALLFPAFALARENARRSSCQSNLKQVGLALLQYAQDYDERLPIGWQNSRPTPFGGWAELLQPYLKSLEVYQCPSEATKYNPLDNTDYTDYAYNATLGRNINNSTYEGIQLSALTDVARTVTFFDSLGHTGSIWTGMWGNGCGNSSSCDAGLAISKTETNGRPAQRHLEGQNFAFCDGHVKWYKGRTATQSDKVYNACTPSSLGGRQGFTNCPVPGTVVSGDSPTFNPYP
jgi:prepilin-type processing-associated H-X9-DG protein